MFHKLYLILYISVQVSFCAVMFTVYGAGFFVKFSKTIPVLNFFKLV